MTKITASELKAGMNVVEADGGLICVQSVAVSGGIVVAVCKSMMSREITLRARSGKMIYVC